MSSKTKRTVRLLSTICVISLVLAGAAFAIEWPMYGKDNSEPYQTSWTGNLAPGSRLSINMTMVDILVETYDGEEVQVAFDGTYVPFSESEQPPILIESNADGLSIREYQPSTKFVVIGIRQPGDVRGTLTVRLPKVALGAVSVKNFSGRLAVSDIEGSVVDLGSSSGHVEATRLVSVGALSISVFSGDVRATDLQADTITIDSSSGKVCTQGITARAFQGKTFSGAVEASQGNISDLTNIETSSGAISLTQWSAGQLSTTQFSGALLLQDVTVATRSDFETSSGKVTAAQCVLGAVNVKTFSGSMTFDATSTTSLQASTSSGACLLDLTAHGDIKIDTFSGRVSLKLPTTSGFAYTLDTFSGRIDVGFSNQANASQQKGQLSGTVGDGSRSIRVETSSGAIELLHRAP